VFEVSVFLLSAAIAGLVVSSVHHAGPSRGWVQRVLTPETILSVVLLTLALLPSAVILWEKEQDAGRRMTFDEFSQTCARHGIQHRSCLELWDGARQPKEAL
jgi:hypothetical protein